MKKPKYLIKGHGFLFGDFEPKPVIRGFEVICKKGEWAIAQQGERRFLVEKQPRFYRLFPVEDMADVVSRRPGVSWTKIKVRKDRAISIPREDE